jgi:hypothetical protein
MQKPADAPRREGPKPKRPPRWRDLSADEQWEQIYKDRKKKQAQRDLVNVPKAAALGLPSYTLQMAIDDCHKTFQATVRHDVHTAILTSMAKVASLLPNEKKRLAMLERMQTHYGAIRGHGFYLNNREFLYANAAALVMLVDDYRFPPDAPVVSAAILLKEDAEMDEEGDWQLDKAHAIKMTSVAYDQYLATELYAYPDQKSG